MKKDKCSASSLKNFRAKVWRHYRLRKRDLPWRHTKNPYHILVSEIMLQQTQVDRVIPKFQQFLLTFPTLKALAAAPFSDVLEQWQGLGYNRRAKYLKLAAEYAIKNHRGRLPETEVELKKLPGIGPYTAAAIAAFAFNQPTVLIETNIRTVFLHEFFSNETDVPDSTILPIIAATVSRRRAGEWYQALMDFGAHLKKTHGNANRRSLHYTKQSSFTGSNRQLRGQIVRELTLTSSISLPALKRLTNNDRRLVKILGQLEREGFILKAGNSISLAL
ncbi:MAG: endonuclease III [Candidatus Andersenbacteria bacterium CG10_big_fil_rev_8_21_14_0_10_54_11]|uniref:Adenine DNA glycosylase n=1 Tax=Candidatus Andersenbacteria bacterium CG10_big_fil_rev_8_21_14_0_10_54_11 TaxID=1974485 RepID=A0A2M6WYT8_9BACT|nr:MAG: endonuclease III [Candidatus Andersenbacteria bacterium CG10_big_fil_rev_8_21_14_0_10_54_11]